MDVICMHLNAFPCLCISSTNKPLGIIQIEDKAIEELLEHYGGLFHPEESIKVARVTGMSGKRCGSDTARPAVIS
jgi:hypothetical protein